MRRVVIIAVAGLVPAAVPAEASQPSAWNQVLREQGVTARTKRIVVRPVHLGPETVVVRIAARGTNTRPVLFPDALYGATAWRWTGRSWRRIDSARVRPAIVRSLRPGERARVRLPLRRAAARVRVLVPVTTHRAAAWVDVRRG